MRWVLVRLTPMILALKILATTLVGMELGCDAAKHHDCPFLLLLIAVPIDALIVLAIWL